MRVTSTLIERLQVRVLHRLFMQFISSIGQSAMFSLIDYSPFKIKYNRYQAVIEYSYFVNFSSYGRAFVFGTNCNRFESYKLYIQSVFANSPNSLKLNINQIVQKIVTSKIHNVSLGQVTAFLDQIIQFIRSFAKIVFYDDI